MQAWCLPTIGTGRRAWDTELLLQQEALVRGGGGAAPGEGEGSLPKSWLRVWATALHTELKADVPYVDPNAPHRQHQPRPVRLFAGEADSSPGFWETMKSPQKSQEKQAASVVTGTSSCGLQGLRTHWFQHF